MAVHLATASDYLQRTTALLPASGDSTVCFWVKSSDVSVNHTAYVILDDPGIYSDFGGIFSHPTHLLLDVNSSVVNGNPLVNDTYVHVAWTQSGTTQRLYINGVSIGTQTVNRAAVVNGFEFLGSDTFDDGPIDVAYVREWTTALTQAQLLDEMQALTAAHTANLYMDCPLTSDILDVSGNGHSWTQVGSATFVAGPSFPRNSSAATATAFGTLPQTITQDFGDGLYGWYSYTGHAGEIIAGFWAYAAIPTDLIVTTVYGSDGTTQFPPDGNIEGTNVPLQVPQSSGTKVYFYVHKAGTPPTTDVTFSAVPGPTSPVPVGAIFTNDEILGFPTACIAPSGNYQVLQFFNPPPATSSENGGDVLEDGTILLADDWTTFQLQRYNGQLIAQGAVSGIVATANTIVRTCVTPQVWYVGNVTISAVTFKAARVDATGTVTANYTIGSSQSALAASNDETVIYTSSSTTNPPPIRQFITGTNSFGANLVAGISSTRIRDMLVLGDDSLLAFYTGTGACIIRRYDAAGALQNTYTLSGSDSNEVSLFHALDDPTSFWARAHDATATCHYYNIKVSDGTVLETITQETYAEGVYEGTATLTPTSRFGISGSCPSFILREAINPPAPTGEPTEYLIRRERWFPVISSGLKRQFFSKLQIDMQTGNGLSTGQGSNPLMEIDWSDDSGWTWSNIRFVETGRIGAYGWRPIARNLSYGRNRVFRIAVSDPVQWVVVGAELDAVLGLS